MYTGSACGGVFVYELLSGRLIARLRWHDEPVRDVSWHPRLPMMGSVSFDGCIALWEPRRGAEHAVAGINGDKFAGFF